MTIIHKTIILLLLGVFFGFAGSWDYADQKQVISQQDLQATSSWNRNYLTQLHRITECQKYPSKH